MVEVDIVEATISETCNNLLIFQCKFFIHINILCFKKINSFLFCKHKFFFQNAFLEK